MKNSRVRIAMFEAGVTQADIAKAYGVTQPNLSVALNTFEFAKKEQDDIIRTVREMKGEKDAESEAERG